MTLSLGCAPTIDEDARLAGTGTARAAPEPKPVPHFTETGVCRRRWQRCCRCANGFPKGSWRGEAKAVILALHGFNDYSNAFDGTGRDLVQGGDCHLCLRSARLWRGARAWVLAGPRRAGGRRRDRHPGPAPSSPRVPVYLLGDSMGGAVAVIAMTGESGTPVPDVDGVILTAPAVWGRPTMGLLPTLALWAGVRLMPGLTLSGRGLEIKPSDNIAMLRALARDPLVIHETRIDAIYGLVDLMDATLASAPLLDAPMLVTYGAKDEIVPKASVRRLSMRCRLEPQRRRDGSPGTTTATTCCCAISKARSSPPMSQAGRSHPAAPPSGADRKAEEAFARGASQASAGGR